MSTLRALLRLCFLRLLLDQDELQLLFTLRTADSWQSPDPITREEAQQWAGFLASPTGQKIDTAMMLAIQQQAQRSCLAAPTHLPTAAGFAAGMRAGWAVAVSISAAVADSTEPESALPASAGLDHLMP